MLAFNFREGGAYRMRLTYLGTKHARGKSTDDADEVEVRLVRLIQDQSIEQEVAFESDDARFGGVMSIVWTIAEVPGGSIVSVKCADVPEGISKADHDAGLRSTLANLANYVEGDR